MKLRLNKSTTLVSACLAVASVLAVFGFLTVSTRSVTAQSEGGRLITVHDRGAETTFVTTKDTLRDAFEDQHIKLDAKDAVEPAIDEKLVAADYQVNIYRARPVTIIDGAVRKKVVTPYQTAERIVKDAGINLFTEDKMTLERSSDFIGDGAGLQLEITRATPILLDLYGKTTVVRTQAHTVSELLKEKKIELGEHGRVSMPVSTAIAANMELRIWREGKQTITLEEAVAFSTEQIKDADRPIGYKAVQTGGANGKRTVTYEVEIKDGQEVARVEIASIETQAPVTQIEVIGSKPNFVPYTGGGSKTDWLASSNIAEENWGYADFLVTKESGWNPNAVNKSSGACGLAQALPCSKLGPNWNNPVVALNWMNQYVQRYGGWEGAYNFWQTRHWY